MFHVSCFMKGVGRGQAKPHTWSELKELAHGQRGGCPLGKKGVKLKVGGPALTPHPPKAQCPGVVPKVHILRDTFPRAWRGRLSSEQTRCREKGRSQGHDWAQGQVTPLNWS